MNNFRVTPKSNKCIASPGKSLTISKYSSLFSKKIVPVKSTSTNQLQNQPPPKPNLDPENRLPQKRPRKKWFGISKKKVIWVWGMVIVVVLGLLAFVFCFFFSVP